MSSSLRCHTPLPFSLPRAPLWPLFACLPVVCDPAQRLFAISSSSGWHVWNEQRAREQMHMSMWNVYICTYMCVYVCDMIDIYAYEYACWHSSASHCYNHRRNSRSPSPSPSLFLALTLPPSLFHSRHTHIHTVSLTLEQQVGAQTAFHSCFRFHFHSLGRWVVGAVVAVVAAGSAVGACSAATAAPAAAATAKLF